MAVTMAVMETPALDGVDGKGQGKLPRAPALAPDRRQIVLDRYLEI
ncbi:hypothetical protein AB4156_37855 [Cupriavidus sp. 2MCAB6]